MIAIQMGRDYFKSRAGVNVVGVDPANPLNLRRGRSFRSTAAILAWLRQRKPIFIHHTLTQAADAIQYEFYFLFANELVNSEACVRAIK
jgi:hypothetical protein